MLRHAQIGLGVLVLAVAAAAPGGHATAAPPSGAQVSAALDGLLAAEPAQRVETASRLGGSWEEGALLAHVLAAVALEDDGAEVRQAARDALESLAVRATATWADFLRDARSKPDEHGEFATVAGEVYRLGARVTPVDYANALSFATSDESQADILGAMPLALRQPDHLDVLQEAGWQQILVHLAATGGPRTMPMARAALVLVATLRLRTQTAGAPSPAPPTTDRAETWIDLLDERDSPWITECAGVALCGCGRPGRELLTRLASVGWLEALAVQGRTAEPVAEVVEGRPAGGIPQASWLALRVRTLVRVGARANLPPSAPPDTPEESRTYAESCAALAALAPDLAHKTIPWLLAHTGSEQPRPTAHACLLALSRMGALPSDATRTLTNLAQGAKASQDRITRSLARLALVRASEADRAARADLVADMVLVDEDDFRVGSAARTELARVLPSMGSALNPVRAEVEAVLGHPRLAMELFVPLLHLLGRMPGRDEGTAELLRRHLRPSGAAQEALGEPPDPIRALRLMGYVASEAVAAQRAAAESLRAIGPRAATAVPDLEALITSPDALLAWRARRALLAIRAK